MGAALAPISMAAGLGGSILSAFGSHQSGEAQSANLQYQAQVAANNAAIAKQNASWDMNAGEVAAANSGLKTRAQVGAEKATQGASGIDPNTGSAVAVRAGTESLGLLDAMTLKSNAAKKAYSDQVQAENDTAQSQLDKQGAAQAVEGGDLGAAGSLLSGVAGIGGKYAGWLQQNPGS